MTIAAILAIDVEPNDRVVRGAHTGWPGFPLLVDCLMHWRTQLAQATGKPVFFNWYLRLDPQIEIAFGKADWVFDRYPDEIDRIARAGDGLGLHVHTWRPHRRFFRNTWLAEFQDQSWIQHCLALGIDAFRARVGTAPATMSFGDNFMHACALPLMEDAGIRADFSMNPGMKPHKALGRGEISSGNLPDYRNTPRHPFRPSAADFRVPGKTNYSVWEVPITSGVVGTEKDGTDKWEKLLWGAHPDWVNAVTEQGLAAPNPYLFAVCRTDVLTHPKTKARFEWALDHYGRLGSAVPLEFIRLETFCDRLESGPPALDS